MGARYSRTTGYTIARRAPARPTVRSVQRRVKFGPTTAKYFGLAILAVLAVIMLSQGGAHNVAAYKITDVRQQSSQVTQDIDRLKLEATRLQSVQAIQSTSAKDTMEAVTSVTHIEQGDVAGVSTTAPTTQP
jgi:hypothetical protein